MAVRTDFVAGEVLAAQDLDDTFASKVNYALPVNPQTGSGASAYTFALADALRLTTASNAADSTYTIPPQVSVAWLANSVIRIVNYGAGVVTIAGGAGVTVTNATKTLSQFESAALIRTASNAWTLVPFSGGVNNANFSDASTGTYTTGGVSYKWIRYTASGTLTVTKAGFADILVVGGGGAGQSNGGNSGGQGGIVVDNYIPLLVQTYTVTVGAGGAAPITPGSTNGSPGGNSAFVTSPSTVGRGGLNSATVSAGHGARGFPSGGTRGIGLTSSITNTSTEYGRGGANTAVAAAANVGEGGGVDLAGGNGCVIIRVRTS